MRSHGELARIEISPDELPRALQVDMAEALAERIRETGFTYVTLDLEGYRQGSLNAALEEEIVFPRLERWTKKDIQRLLEDVRAGKLSVARALEQLRHMPYEDLGFAKIDHHRVLRQGFAEVIYAKGKTAAANCGDRARNAAPAIET